MIRRKRVKQPLPVGSAVVELRNLLTSPVPSEYIAGLSEPVVRGLLLSLVMEARYGNE